MREFSMIKYKIKEVKIIKEEWRAIKLEGVITHYEISNIGRCRNIQKLHWKTKGILKPKFNKNNGYESYCIASPEWEKYKYRYAHRLVLSHFKPTKNKKLHVNHIDGNKRNNRLDNLEWCTCKENMAHAVDNELIGKPVFQYSLQGVFIKRFSSATEAARKLGLTPRAISQSLYSPLINSQCGGYQWRFENDNVKPVINIEKNYKSSSTGIVQLNLNNDFIQDFPNATRAYEAIGKVDNGHLIKVAKSKNNTYLGYKWVLSEDYYKNIS